MDVEYSLNGIRFEWDRRKAVANLSRWIESEIVGGDERERLMGMTSV